MKPLGGSEIIYNKLVKYLGPEWFEKINLIVSVCNPQLLDLNRINVIWQQLSYDQGNVQLMQDPGFVDSVDYFVYNSDWCLNEFNARFPISGANNSVIKNGVDPIEYLEKPKDKIRLIYTSMPNRGLEVLLDAFELLNRNDIELIVYSSNIIYGKGYASVVNYDQLFHRCRTMKNVIYKGYAMNNAVRSALQKAHIWSYPSIFEETSCMAAMEAGAAGCKIVTTSFGALPETCDQWATYVEYNLNRRELAHNYAEVLANEIDSYDPSAKVLKEQSDWFNNNYSLIKKADEWREFFKQIENTR